MHTYMHIVTSREVCMCVCWLCRARVSVTRIDPTRHTCTREPVRARAHDAMCTRASRTYVRICIIIVAYVARDTYVSTLYSVYMYNPSTSVFQSPSPLSRSSLLCSCTRARPTNRKINVSDRTPYALVALSRKVRKINFVFPSLFFPSLFFFFFLFASLLHHAPFRSPYYNYVQSCSLVLFAPP